MEIKLGGTVEEQKAAIADAILDADDGFGVSGFAITNGPIRAYACSAINPFAKGNPVALVVDKDGGNLQLMQVILSPELIAMTRGSDGNVSRGWVASKMLQKPGHYYVVAAGDNIRMQYVKTENRYDILCGTVMLASLVVGENSISGRKINYRDTIYTIIAPSRVPTMASVFEKVQVTDFEYFCFVMSLIPTVEARRTRHEAKFEEELTGSEA